MSQDPRLILKVCALFCAMIVVCFDAEAQWTAVETGVEDDLYAVYFLDDTYGLATGWGDSPGAVTIKTIDGGESWTTVVHNNGSYMFDVYCSPDYLTTYNAGYRGGACVGVSTNGGVTWNLHNITGSFGLYAIEFPTEEIAFTCGYDGSIFKSTDAGDQWDRLDTGTGTMVFTALSAPDEEHIYAMAGTSFASPNQFYRSVDGGETWENNYTFSGVIAQLMFLSADTGIAVGNASGEVVFKTNDGGTTWTRKHTGPGSRVLQDACFSEAHCWAVGDAGRVLRSDDRGETWVLDATMSPAAGLLGVSEAGGVVYVCGAGGRMFKRSLDQTGTDDSLPMPTQFELEQNYPNPFNPLTEIRFTLAKAGQVELEVFNTMGELVDLLIDQEMTAGPHELQYDATGTTSGVYLYRLSAGGASETRKMILLK